MRVESSSNCWHNQTDKHCSTLGVVHHGIAFPLIWIMLDKKGNSNTRERCELWNRFLEIFADRQIDVLSADREFVGGH